jgi:hypothetical protein
MVSMSHRDLVGVGYRRSCMSGPEVQNLDPCGHWLGSRLVDKGLRLHVAEVYQFTLCKLLESEIDELLLSLDCSPQHMQLCPTRGVGNEIVVETGKRVPACGFSCIYPWDPRDFHEGGIWP